MRVKTLIKIFLLFLYHGAAPFIYLSYCTLFWNKTSVCHQRMFIPIFAALLLGMHRCISCFAFFLLKSRSFDLEITLTFWIVFGVNLFNDDSLCQESVSVLEIITKYFFYIVLVGNTCAFSLFYLLLLILSINTIINAIEFAENENLENIQRNTGLTDNEFLKLQRIIFINKNAKKIKKIKDETVVGGSTCPICLVTFTLNEILVKPPVCQHLFHVDCLKEWVKNHHDCPYCRRNMKEDLENSIRLQNENQSVEEIFVNSSKQLESLEQNEENAYKMTEILTEKKNKDERGKELFEDLESQRNII